MPLSPDSEPTRLLSAALERLAAGDLSARDAIIELSAARLRVLAHRMLARFPSVRRWDDTDDVFQNAVLRLHRSLAHVSLDSPRAVMSLAAMQLHRELIDLARRYSGPASFAANHATDLGPPADRSSAASPAAFADAAAPSDPLERWTQFHDAITTLPVELREVFHLVWYLDADQKTISALLGCSERTVKYRWRKAREAIRAALEGDPPE
jgi:RNA polymerase sigma factor (sigma-70 family)